MEAKQAADTDPTYPNPKMLTDKTKRVPPVIDYLYLSGLSIGYQISLKVFAIPPGAKLDGNCDGRIAATSIVTQRTDSRHMEQLGSVTRVTAEPSAAFSACKIRASVASGRQSKWARISRMDWEEVRVRAGQEFHKQSDLLKHRMGWRNGTLRLGPDSATQPGQFFFSASDFYRAASSERVAPSERSERAELLRKHLPGEAAEILREADEICAHRFRLLGYENLDYGREIDWHLDRVHGKRARLDPWFKIPFLDFAAVGDHKVTWELNRHQHLVTLAKAQLLSGSGSHNDND